MVNALVTVKVFALTEIMRNICPKCMKNCLKETLRRPNIRQQKPCYYGFSGVYRLGGLTAIAQTFGAIMAPLITKAYRRGGLHEEIAAARRGGRTVALKGFYDIRSGSPAVYFIRSIN